MAQGVQFWSASAASGMRQGPGVEPMESAPAGLAITYTHFIRPTRIMAVRPRWDERSGASKALLSERLSTQLMIVQI